MEILYIATDADSLHHVAPLWKKLKRHHVERSTDFKQLMAAKTWEKRREELLRHAAGGRLRVDLAYHDNEVIGYCVSTVNADSQGEVESIYIEDAFRKHGIGRALIERADNWFSVLGVKRRIIALAAGNEEVLPFYRKLGYYPRVTIVSTVENDAAR